jgi:thiamine-phosphate pyrophosphorylase
VIQPRLIAITDTALVPADLLAARLAALVTRARPGSVAIQLRDHQLSARARLELGRRLLEIARREAAPLIVNDRLDLALALGAQGVHLGERSVAPADARRLLPKAWISRACHDPDRVADAPEVDAVLLSPILSTRKGRPALGLCALRRARQLLPASIALIALGGIDAEGAARCLEAGADAVAAIGSVLAGSDERSLDALLDALQIRRA